MAKLVTFGEEPFITAGAGRHWIHDGVRFDKKADAVAKGMAADVKPDYDFIIKVGLSKNPTPEYLAYCQEAAESRTAAEIVSGLRARDIDIEEFVTSGKFSKKVYELVANIPQERAATAAKLDSTEMLVIKVIAKAATRNILKISPDAYTALTPDERKETDKKALALAKEIYANPAHEKHKWVAKARAVVEGLA